MRIINLQKKYHTLPALDLDILIAKAVNQPKEFLYSHPEYNLSIWENLKLKYFVFLRNRDYSVAAIVGHKEFYGLDFLVNKHTLIPRPDTELMVAEAARIMNYELRIKNTNIQYIDVGTGSGCIPISIIKTLAHKNINTFATDISGSALQVAKKNANEHGVSIKFFRGNLLEPILKNIGFRIQDTAIIITANLPYLTEQQFKQESSIQKEPKIALVAKNNGLALYEELLGQIKRLPYILNSKFCILLEIDPSQSEMIIKIIKQDLPDSNIEIKKDLSGLDRLVIIKSNQL